MPDDDPVPPVRAQGEPESDDPARGEERFREALVKCTIAIPLLEDIKADPTKVYPFMIDLNLDYPGGRDLARKQVVKLVHRVMKTPMSSRAGDKWPAAPVLDQEKSEAVEQYVFGRLTGEEIQNLVEADHKAKPPPAIYRIWPDFELRSFITESVRTVKCDAARVSFNAMGDQIVWAVMDSGIDQEHPHFAEYCNLDLPQDVERQLVHRDFTGGNSPLTDAFGHGTHVAGIIAGGIPPLGARTADVTKTGTYRWQKKYRDGQDKMSISPRPIEAIFGMAPRARLVSLKVLDENGNGSVGNLLAAIAWIQQVNGNGRRLKIHGVNLSVGYPFDPEWFACGQSPLCVEVNRLVRSGVAVVAAAGNSGYGVLNAKFTGPWSAGLFLTINDPGNADKAITVGSTHRDSPHLYGVSYFSSKGPTGDGRVKPDLIAPGEKIVSCAAGQSRQEVTIEGEKVTCDYREESGTSMAAPHVSGALAAFLSVRREFIGRPEEVKRIFMETATDLGREPRFQGHGLLDLMRAMQAV